MKAKGNALSMGINLPLHIIVLMISHNHFKKLHFKTNKSSKLSKHIVLVY